MQLGNSNWTCLMQQYQAQDVQPCAQPLPLFTKVLQQQQHA
jgi:hypothetical protein